MKYFPKVFDSSLGTDFWKFRFGQLVSLLGDGCRSVALSWWVLDKTGSAKAIASVLVPAMAVNLVLMPLFGPLGDNFPRKRLIVLADFGRSLLACAMAGMALFNYFDLRLVAALYAFSSMGTALFNAAEGGIIPQIVKKKNLQTALRHSYGITAFGGVGGGILGGLVVSFLGIPGAFLVDAASFLTAGLSSSLIGANTTPKRKRNTPLDSVGKWRNELLDGFRMLLKIPVLFWICMLAMLFNFIQAPFWVALPVFVKLGRNLPAWFLGTLQGGIALGTILGSIGLAWGLRTLGRKALLFSCVVIQGMSFLLLPWCHGLVLPVLVTCALGLGSSMINIQLDTQLALVIPDSHRSRFNSIIEFLCLGLYPVGMALGSLAIAQVGLTVTLDAMGLLGILQAPLLFLIPKFMDLMEVPAHKAGGFLKKHYPEVAL